MRRSVASDLFGTFSTDVVLSVLGILTGSLTARWLLPEGRGALAAALFWPQLLAGLGLLSLTEATTYRTGTRRKKSSSILSSSLWLAIALSGIVMTAGVLAMPVLLGEGRSELVDLSRKYLLFFIPFNFLTLVLLASDQGNVSFSRYNTLRVMPPIVYLAGLFLLRANHRISVGWVAAADCAATIVVALSRLLPAGRALFALPSREEMKALMKLAGRFHVASVLLFLSIEADTFAVLLLWDNAALGRYAVALSIASSSMTVASGALQKVLFPHLSQIQGGTDQIRLFRKGISSAALVLTALLVLVEVSVPWLIPVMFGPAFRDIVAIAQVLLVGYFFVSLKSIFIASLRGLGESRPGSIASGLALGIFLLLVAPLGNSFGLMGVGISLGFSNAVALFYLVHHLRKRYQVNFFDSSDLIPRRVKGP
ncbi:MAG: lipopolysaccharide biosynthesis protein [Candidatus Omnitrophica bacterium]|nr:lipopolysaccharide biosynthesis protein [Candidatus Omnitrophota bacterium]